jgi:hypothetical protein
MTSHSVITIDDIVMDEEFAGVHRPHFEAENEDLVKAIEEVNRIVNPILVIEDNGQYPVIDGYHRLQYWYSRGSHLGVPAPKVEVMTELKSRQQAVFWMRILQNGGRNYSVEEQRYQRGKALVEEVALRNQSVGVPRKVSEIIADIATAHEVSPSTVRRDKEYAEAVERIGEIDLPLSHRIRAGTVGINVSETIHLATLCEAEMRAACANLTAGRAWDDCGVGDVTIGAKESPEMARFRQTNKKFATLQKTLMPQVREHLIELSRLIHPKGQPKVGGFPMKVFNEATETIHGALIAWRPEDECPDCEMQGCGRCGQRGWLRRGGR